jgi:hypothetical protein
MLRLDYIFVSPSIDVIDVQTVRTPLARFASDHFPVVAELELAVPGAPARQRHNAPAHSALENIFDAGA